MRSTLKQYNELSMHYRVSLLEQESVFIAFFLTLETTTSLYFYNNYYVELVVDNESNDLVDIVAFDDMQVLDKYLEDITLEDLMPARK